MMDQSRDVFSPVVQVLPLAVAVVGSAVPAGCSLEIVSMLIANNDAAARTFTLHLHPSSVAPAAGNAICTAVPINANTIYQFPGPVVIPQGWQLSGLADAAAAVVVTLTGYIFNEAA
jgi:hypothetical protein